MLLPGSGRHAWDAGCASRRQLSPARAYCGSAMSACGSETYRVSLALRANCMALCARSAVGPRSDHVGVRTHCLAWQAQRFRQVESNISWHAQHVRPQGPVGVSWQARYFRRVRYRFRGRRDISKAKRSRPARRTTSARSGSDFLAERFDARRVFSRLRLAVHTAVRGN